MLNPITLAKLRAAKIPGDRFLVPFGILPAKDRENIDAFLASIDRRNINKDGWWTIQSAKGSYGQSVWGPEIGLDPNDGAVVLKLGQECLTLAELGEGWIVSEEEGNFYLSKDRWQIKLRTQPKQRLRILRNAHQEGNLGAYLAELLLVYPPLSALPVGVYSVVGYGTYPGFEGQLAYKIQVQTEHGLFWFRANSRVDKDLALEPIITRDIPAVLEVTGHAQTQQGHAMAIVNFSCQFEEADERYNFQPASPVLALAGSEDDDDDEYDFVAVPPEAMIQD